jgi:hypothetical protein
MDKHLTLNESKLQDLLHAKDYSGLNRKEVEFVLMQSSKEDYVLERAVILNAKTLFHEDQDVKPAPLVIPLSSNHIRLNKEMPIYQSLLLVAATIIIMLMIFPVNNNTIIDGTKTEYIVNTDTIKIEKEVIKYDTIYQTVEKPIYINKEIYVESKPCSEPIREEPRLLNSNSTFSLPELTQNSVSNNGKSMKDDNVSSLIVEF